jgi:hypothetical protein
MSGSPNKADVVVLVSHMLSVQSLSCRKRQHESTIRDAEAEIKKIEEELAPLTSRVHQLLRGMDVESSGNWGHENRVTALSFLIMEEGMRRGAAEAAGACPATD